MPMSQEDGDRDDEEPEVTPEMIEAGIRVLCRYFDWHGNDPMAEGCVAEVFTRMHLACPKMFSLPSAPVRLGSTVAVVVRDGVLRLDYELIQLKARKQGIDDSER